MDLVEFSTARQERIIKQRHCWDVQGRSGCWKETGKPTIGATRVDGTKHPDGETLVRSRFVARDSSDKADKRDDLFAATPPLDMLKSLL